MLKFYSPLKPLLTGFAILFTACYIFSSCGNTRNYVYMQGQFDTARLSKIPIADPVVQKGDLVSIIVYSDNPAATSLYNQPLIAATAGTAGGGASSAGNSPGGGTGSTAGAATVASPTSPGYLVDGEGNIEFQGLGLLHIEGLTKNQIKELLNSKLKTFLNNPYYTIRFLNYKFTMLGEVTHPGIFTIPGEHINLLEALGLAGDMTFYGSRSNILVVRENNGKREFGRMDITKPEIMASPYFYIQSNDIVIVEPTKKKIVASDEVATRNISLTLAVVSTLTVLYSIFKK